MDASPSVGKTESLPPYCPNRFVAGSAQVSPSGPQLHNGDVWPASRPRPYQQLQWCCFRHQRHHHHGAFCLASRPPRLFQQLEQRCSGQQKRHVELRRQARQLPRFVFFQAGVTAVLGTWFVANPEKEVCMNLQPVKTDIVPLSGDNTV
jgi:hypothetical protein